MSLSWKEETCGAGKECPQTNSPGSFLLFASNSHPQEKAQTLYSVAIVATAPAAASYLEFCRPREPPALGNKTLVLAWSISQYRTLSWSCSWQSLQGWLLQWSSKDQYVCRPMLYTSLKSSSASECSGLWIIWAAPVGAEMWQVMKRTQVWHTSFKFQQSLQSSACFLGSVLVFYVWV